VIGKVAGISGIASQLTTLLALIITVSRSPWFSWTRNYLSVFGVEGPAIGLFNSGLIASGIFSLIFAIGLGKSSFFTALPGKLGVSCLSLGSASFAAIGLFPRTTDIPHNLASLGFFLFVSLAIFFIGVQTMRKSLAALGILSFLTVSVIVTFELSPWPGGAIAQLITVLPWSVWTVVFSIMLLARAD
jgi:hypothetical membrane protein